jgi:probable F420-dependent oxidoreductase
VKFTLEYPSEVPDAAPGFLDPDVIMRLAVQAEECGFDAIAFSDHPAPSLKWRHAGGHDTIDPTTALSFVAAATRRIRLLTNLYVLPFRNPYLAAKNLSSLDILSGGRLTAGIGAGYLRSEFSALGVDFDRRARLFDSGLAALVSIWRRPEEPIVGDGFAATTPLWLSRPVQKPHPPIWIGGNSKAALRRVVQFGEGWCPVIAPPAMATSVRTMVIDNRDTFRQAVEDLHRRLLAAGRDPASVDIQIEFPLTDLTADNAVRQALERLDEFAELGATWAIAHVDASSVNAAADYLTAFSDAVIARRQQHRPANAS